jgi:hypothetical protein
LSTLSRIIRVGSEGSNIVVSLYPNPFSLQINAALLSTFDRNVILQVYDMNGEMVLNQIINLTEEKQNLITIDALSNSSSGLYYFKLFDALSGEILESQLIVKQ